MTQKWFSPTPKPGTSTVKKSKACATYSKILEKSSCILQNRRNPYSYILNCYSIYYSIYYSILLTIIKHQPQSEGTSSPSDLAPLLGDCWPTCPLEWSPKPRPQQTPRWPRSASNLPQAICDSSCVTLPVSIAHTIYIYIYIYIISYSIVWYDL